MLGTYEGYVWKASRERERERERKGVREKLKRKGKEEEWLGKIVGPK
jgi:hypothetical protein